MRSKNAKVTVGETGKPLKMKRPRVSEKIEQNNAVAVLRACDYVVLELGQKRLPVFCRACGCKTWPTFTDSTGGTPDTMLTHSDWARQGHANTWHAQEYKGPGTPVRPAQQALVEGGMSGIVHNAQEAARDVIAFELSMGIEPNARLVAWLGETA